MVATSPVITSIMSHLQEVFEQHLSKDVILFRYLFTGRE